VKKMKNLKVLMLIALMGLLAVNGTHAATSANLAVSAQIPTVSMDMTVSMKELTTPGQEPWTGADVTSMFFGTLTHLLTDGSEAGVWYSQKYYCAFIFSNSFGQRYELKSSCSGLTSGGNSLPAASFGLTPAYQDLDSWTADGLTPQGAMPTGATLGTAGPAITTNKIVYRSEPAATNHIIRAFYSLPCYDIGGANPFPGYQPIALTQAPGTYSGTVTITIAAY
jgi:hypothetical protein